jgi:hypothetical protein
MSPFALAQLADERVHGRTGVAQGTTKMRLPIGTMELGT